MIIVPERMQGRQNRRRIHQEQNRQKHTADKALAWPSFLGERVYLQCVCILDPSPGAARNFCTRSLYL